MTGSIKAYNELTTSLLSQEERQKFEWAIGAVLTGGPSHIVVLLGPEQSGKTTLTRIVRHILTRFEGECSPRVVFREVYEFQSSMFSEADGDTFVFVEAICPTDTGEALVINTIGKRIPIPVNKYYVLTDQIESELDAIAEVCINRYRSMGEDHYR